MHPLRQKRLSRRTVLRGLGGVAIGLPLLDAMLPRSIARGAGEIPKRFVILFGGFSNTANGGGDRSEYVPDTVGAGYSCERVGLKPLLQNYTGNKPVRDDVSVISGLAIPVGGPASRPNVAEADFHISSMAPALTGSKQTAAGGVHPTGASADQIVNDVIGGGRLPLLARVQVSIYAGYTEIARSQTSYKKAASGAINLQPSVENPQVLFRRLFGSFVPPAPGMPSPDAGTADPLVSLRAQAGKSVLDTVLASSKQLQNQLGAADKRRLSDHLDEVRSLEQRINGLPTVEGGSGAGQLGAACVVPKDPGAWSSDAGSGSMTNKGGYTDENKRAPVILDLVHMALACDVSRVASVALTWVQSFMNIPGMALSVHESGHSQGSNLVMGQVIAWHVDKFAYLVDKMRMTPEGGGNMLDNSVVFLVNEGGAGPGGIPHSTEKMVTLAAGRAGGFKAGQHLATNRVHPAQVLLTGMNAVGVQTNALNEVSGLVPGLL